MVFVVLGLGKAYLDTPFALNRSILMLGAIAHLMYVLFKEYGTSCPTSAALLIVQIDLPCTNFGESMPSHPCGILCAVFVPLDFAADIADVLESLAHLHDPISDQPGI